MFAECEIVFVNIVRREMMRSSVILERFRGNHYVCTGHKESTVFDEFVIQPDFRDKL